MIGISTPLVIAYLVIASLSLYPVIYQLIIIATARPVKQSLGIAQGRVGNGTGNLLVVIPAKSEPIQLLEEAMRRFSGMKPIFILDNYPPELRPMIEGMARRYGVKVMFREKAVGFKGGALNHVIKRVEPPNNYLMAVFDVDSSIDPKHLEVLLRYAEHYDAVVPHWVARNGDYSQLARGQWIGYLLLFKVMDGLQRLIHWVPVLGSGSIVRVGSLRRVGYWPEDVLEDVELGVRFFINGLTTYYVDDAQVYVDVPTNYWGFLTQQLRWAYGATKVLRKYLKDLMSRRGGLTVALYLGQYLGYLLEFLSLLLMVAMVILNIELPLWAFITVATIYIPVLLTYLYSLLRLDIEHGGNVRRDIFAINAVNLAFIMAMPRLAVANLMALLGVGGINWVPTPKGSVTINKGGAHALPELVMVITVVSVFIASLLRGLWLDSLVLLPYTAGFVRGLWRILKGTL
ncbi:glycosyltransferase family 2 protein [Vulcanisaeta thermophila]|uniref:glycosyltransferase family 2 protein n=1 Tax=Vulcanisaeta thermophila TaxID=867917 RepID=UPI000853E334|nr:glycosyltransferase family 2 protein [Vulcanisaeta thermophila]